MSLFGKNVEFIASDAIVDALDVSINALDKIRIYLIGGKQNGKF